MGLCSAKCTSLARLDGKTAIVTGSNTGIGKCTAMDFLERGARVIMACRNETKAQEAAEEIKKLCKNKNNLGELVTKPLDISSFQSIRKFADNILQTEDNLTLLVNNAGVMLTPYSKTEDGFEMTFGTNHLGHFLLTMLLLPKLIDSAPSRIVNVSSTLHTYASSVNFSDLNWEKTQYSAMQAYYQSKLANILFAKELAKKLKEHGIEGVTTYSLHPGVIRSDLSRHTNDVVFPGFRFLYDNIFGWFLKSTKQGAQTTIYCAVDEKCAKETGLYYAECKVTNSSQASMNEDEATKLWTESVKLVKLDSDYNPFIKKQF